MNINQVTLKTTGGLTYDNHPQYLILHHADMNGSIQAVNQVHLNEGFTIIGYNYYVRKDGGIFKGRPENARGENCYGYNTKSISICAEGNFMIDIMSAAQKASIIWLGQNIESRYNHKLIVKGHKEMLATACPGANYPLADIKNKISNNIILTSSPIKTVPKVITPVKVDISIRNFQKVLNILGFLGANGKALIEDGVTGQNTITSLNSCKKVFGFPINGIYDIATMNAINSILAKPIVRLNSKGLAVNYLQNFLHVAIDGIFGVNSANHLKAWQLKNGLVGDSICGSSTYAKIFN